MAQTQHDAVRTSKLSTYAASLIATLYTNHQFAPLALRATLFTQKAVHSLPYVRSYVPTAAGPACRTSECARTGISSSSNITLCGKPALFFHVTLSPALIVTLEGSNTSPPVSLPILMVTAPAACAISASAARLTPAALPADATKSRGMAMATGAAAPQAHQRQLQRSRKRALRTAPHHNKSLSWGCISKYQESARVAPHAGWSTAPPQLHPGSFSTKQHTLGCSASHHASTVRQVPGHQEASALGPPCALHSRWIERRAHCPTSCHPAQAART